LIEETQLSQRVCA